MKIKNYISFNAKYYKKSCIEKIHKHNIRESNIDYLIEPIAKNITDTNLQNEFNCKYQQMKDIAKKRKSYVKEYGNHIVEAVVAVSEDMPKHIITQDGNADRLYLGFKQVAEDIKDKFGFEPLQVSLHLDEGHKKQIESINFNKDTYQHNIHAHLTFLNYDFKKEQTILRTLKQSDWKLMQDIAALAFKKHGMDFHRGKEKLSKGKDHLERNEFIAQEQAKKLYQLQKDIDIAIENKKSLIQVLKIKRADIAQTDTDITIKKEQYSRITQNQKLLRADVKKLKAHKKELHTNQKEILEDFENRAHQIATQGKPSRNEVIERIINELKDISNINILFNENIQKEEQITDITNINNTLAAQNGRLKNKITMLEATQQEVESLQQEKEQLHLQNTELLADIDELSVQYKFNYKIWKASRQSRYTAFKDKRVDKNSKKR